MMYQIIAEPIVVLSTFSDVHSPDYNAEISLDSRSDLVWRRSSLDCFVSRLKYTGEIDVRMNDVPSFFVMPVVAAVHLHLQFLL